VHRLRGGLTADGGIADGKEGPMNHVVVVESNPLGLGLVDAALRRGARVTFVRSPQYAYNYRGSPFADALTRAAVVEVADSCAAGHLTPALAALHEKDPVTTLVTPAEWAVPALAVAAETLGLPFTSSRGAANAADKTLTRACLEKAGLPSTPYVRVDGIGGLRRAVAAFGHPCVIKPAEGFASIGAHAGLRGPEDSERAIAGIEATFRRQEKFAHWRFTERFIVERHLTGPMVSLELAADGRVYEPIAVLQRQRAVGDCAVELGNVAPAPLTDEGTRAVVAYGIGAARALGLDLGVFNLEMILTRDGPVLIEANARMLGGSAPLLISRTWDVDFFGLVLDVYGGRPLTGTPRPAARTGLSQLLSVEETAVCAADPDDPHWRGALDPRVTDLVLDARPGERVEASLDATYRGWFLAVAEDVREALSVRDDTLRRLEDRTGLRFTRSTHE
jgi:biotin carboxylase